MNAHIIVMGPAGCGKSTLGAALAEAIGARFIEGDALHPPINRTKMAAGEPLTDADRLPFLDAVAAVLAASNVPMIASCSALKRAYRDHIRARAGRNVAFILPLLSRAALATRLAARTDHFMPPALLDSQLAILEQPQADETAFSIDGTMPVADQIAAIRAMLKR